MSNERDFGGFSLLLTISIDWPMNTLSCSSTYNHKQRNRHLKIWWKHWCHVNISLGENYLEPTLIDWCCLLAKYLVFPNSGLCAVDCGMSAGHQIGDWGLPLFLLLLLWMFLCFCWRCVGVMISEFQAGLTELPSDKQETQMRVEGSFKWSRVNVSRGQLN